MNPESRCGPWKCFHCNELFEDEAQAITHFGKDQRHSPACQIDIVEYREMESRMELYYEEDSDLHRQIYAMQAQHSTAIRHAEEIGYARGLRDGLNMVSVKLQTADNGVGQG